LPSALLRHAAQRASTLRHLGEDTIDGTTAHVISYTDEDGTAHSLYIEQQTGLLVRADRLEAGGQLGDAVAWTTFADYHEHSGERFPTHRVERRIERDSAATLKLTFDAPRLNTEPGPDLFTPPSGVLNGAEWVVTAAPPSPAKIVEIGRDLFI